MKRLAVKQAGIPLLEIHEGAMPAEVANKVRYWLGESRSGEALVLSRFDSPGTRAVGPPGERRTVRVAPEVRPDGEGFVAQSA